MHRKRRINIALVLLSASLVLDVAILVSGGTFTVEGGADVDRCSRCDKRDDTADRQP